MANKRMFTMKICDSDAFLDMPLSSQCLYFHLNMRADDDGFIDNPKRIMKIVGASQDDLNILIAKSFVLTFDNGVIVIKHWRMHNTLSKQRYHETQYVDEKNMLRIKENGSYSFNSGIAIDDSKTEEMFKLADKRRTSGEQVENADIDLDLDKELDLVKDIVCYLNQKLGTQYRASSEKTKKHIRARLSEGYTFSDFRNVIDKKYEEWHSDPKMAQYLRPETLFGTKFESYLNQKVIKPQKSKNSFNNFSQRETDYDELERKLLGF